MRKDWKEMAANKAAFIEGLQTALVIDARSNLHGLAYEIDLETKEEYIVVCFADGSHRRVPATGNSNYANAKVILEAIYG